MSSTDAKDAREEWTIRREVALPEDADGSGLTCELSCCPSTDVPATYEGGAVTCTAPSCCQKVLAALCLITPHGRLFVRPQRSTSVPLAQGAPPRGSGSL